MIYILTSKYLLIYAKIPAHQEPAVTEVSEKREEEEGRREGKEGRRGGGVEESNDYKMQIHSLKYIPIVTPRI